MSLLDVYRSNGKVRVLIFIQMQLGLRLREEWRDGGSVEKHNSDNWISCSQCTGKLNATMNTGSFGVDFHGCFPSKFQFLF